MNEQGTIAAVMARLDFLERRMTELADRVGVVEAIPATDRPDTFELEVALLCLGSAIVERDARRKANPGHD